MPRSDDVFLRHVVDAVPELRPLLDEHLVDDNEMIPHVFMGEVQSWAEDHVEDQPEAVARLIEQLDRGLRTGDEMVANVISVSFLEYLPAAGEHGGGVRRMLTPLLAEDLRGMERG